MAKFVVRLIREVTSVEYHEFEVIVEAETEGEALDRANVILEGGYEVDEEMWDFVQSETVDESQEAVSARPIGQGEFEGDYEVMSN